MNRPRWTRRYGVWVLALLVGVGALIQACSDNSGPAGPSFNSQGQPVPTTGTADTAAQILIRVAANPASTEPGRRVGVTVLVTNTNGFPLKGRRVTVNSTTTAGNAFGQIDQPVGTTDVNGIYTTTMIVRCVDAGATGTTGATGGSSAPASGQAASTVQIDAFVDGASSAITGGSAFVNVTGPSGNPPCPGDF